MKSRRLDERDRAARGPLAEAAVDLPLFVLGEQVAVHVAGAPAHHVAGEDVLAHRRLREALRRDDLAAACGDVLIARHALDAAPVVDVAVGVDDGHDRAPRDVLLQQLERRGRHLRRDQRVDDDPPGVALDEADHREVHAAHLVDAVAHLEEAVEHVEARVAPEAGVHGRGSRFGVEERIGGQVPHGGTVGLGDGRRLKSGDEAAGGVLKVLLVRPVEAGVVQQCVVGRLGVLRGVAASAHLILQVPDDRLSPDRSPASLSSDRPPDTVHRADAGSASGHGGRAIR